MFDELVDRPDLERRAPSSISGPAMNGEVQGDERRAVDGALEGRAGLVGGEGEGRAALAARVGRPGEDRRVGLAEHASRCSWPASGRRSGSRRGRSRAPASVCRPAEAESARGRPRSASNGPPSSEHSNSSTGSLLGKPKIDVRTGVRAAGAATMNVSGGVVSTGADDQPLVEVRAIGSTTPARSTARTWKTCGPTGRPVDRRAASVQATKSALSSEHSNSKTGSPGHALLAGELEDRARRRRSPTRARDRSTCRARTGRRRSRCASPASGRRCRSSSIARTAKRVLAGGQRPRPRPGVSQPSNGTAVERALELELEVERLVVGAGELEDGDEVRRSAAGGALVIVVSGGVVSTGRMTSHS